MALSAAQPEYTFINLTDNPVKNRDERRSFVRRAVMSDYHKRRKRYTNSQDTILSQLRTRTFLGESGAESGHSESVRFEGAINDSSDTYIARSLTPLEQFSVGLFQPKYWADPQHAQMSRLVTGFLCGQTIKAAQDMSYVAFIHRKFQGACKEFDTINNPLKSCGVLLRAFASGSSSADLYCAALWDIVHEQQEEIYKQIETLGKWELLSASQAITLYILLWLRMRRRNGKFAHGNIALLFTLGVRSPWVHFLSMCSD
ncbi:hypothetical protein BGW36DRAFT_373061 [Talaromyces proteolyticus]|uniref:Uncharacterized protein n=1 Tax=Talaromyces proteolyticus TaxID=1131652 RepID=A0AAD4KWP4_9EURO|nr:uncharacterized protein BGW36DRAFT_373061 [Talaromyces proteolyticus]KAH8702552.1 hypothetical protein BGW36DRAFT_373061 [Talaromyces proteolyticus]